MAGNEVIDKMGRARLSKEHADVEMYNAAAHRDRMSDDFQKRLKSSSLFYTDSDGAVRRETTAQRNAREAQEEVSKAHDNLTRI